MCLKSLLYSFRNVFELQQSYSLRLAVLEISRCLLIRKENVRLDYFRLKVNGFPIVSFRTETSLARRFSPGRR